MADRDWIQESYDLGDRLAAPEEITKLYDDWVKNGLYEKNLMDAGYCGYSRAASRLAELIPENKEARILDVGAGTGLVGEELMKLGFSNICALDPSQESMNVAREKGCYKELVRGYAGGPDGIPFEENTFDEAISSGVFGPGYSGGSSLKDMMRTVKPGGHIVIATDITYFDDDHGDYDLRKVSDDLVARKLCSLVREDIPAFCRNEMGVLLVYKVS